MMGVLEARSSGREYYLHASSGSRKPPWIKEPWIKPKHLDRITYHPGRWTLVNSKVPENNREWLTVRGERMDLLDGMAGVSRQCSAVKLLLGPGGMHIDWRSVECVRVSEMVYAGPKVEDADAEHMRMWARAGCHELLDRPLLRRMRSPHPISDL